MSAMTFVMPVLMVVLVVASFIYRSKATAKFNADYANYKLADIAALLELDVSEGPPQLNLMNVHAEHAQQAKQGGGMLAKLNGDGMQESFAAAAGTRWGRPYRFEYSQRTEVETKENLFQSTRTTREWFGMSLSAALNGERPRFEIHMREWAQFCEPRLQTSLPAKPTGIASLDAVIVVKCEDPALAAALAPALVPLMTDQTLHIVGTGTEVRALATRYTYGTLLMNLSTHQKGLEHIACILEGRDASHVTG
ncbi:MAG: hypothetical protein H6726_29990 [Sandaracinaceae bacterium]|nr:hypothetical protein [Sandaracinaceae bacterium]